VSRTWRFGAARKMPVQLRIACRGSVTTGGRFESGEGGKPLDGSREPMGTAGSAVNVAAESVTGASHLNADAHNG
jgi:hypothetical protein